MSTRIFKYPLKIEDEQIIKMPLGYRILTVQVKDNVPCLWALVDDEEMCDRIYHQWLKEQL